MLAEIISIGTELTSGQNLDTNSQWLSLRLAEMGIAVGWHTTLPDDLDLNVAALRLARDRADLVLITGGLGPTQDDLTRQALADLLGVPLYLHEPSLTVIREMFSSRKRIMPEANQVQAQFPEGSEPIANDRGTAPGIWLEAPRLPHAEGRRPTLFIAMPGVPNEMYAMFTQQVLPRLRSWTGTTGVLVQRKINCFGAGESAVEEKVRDLTRRGFVPDVGITVSDATISLRILARAATVEAAQHIIAPVEATIRERLGDLVFGVEDEGLEHAVARLLCSHHRTLSVAEGVTGGHLSQRLTSVPGISQHFRGGVIAYGGGTKSTELAVADQLIHEHGLVSAPVAEAMARACRVRFGSDFALSTVGVAGPGGATPDKPIGLTFVALAWATGSRSHGFNWFTTRSEIQSRTAKTALNLLRLHLLHEGR